MKTIMALLSIVLITGCVSSMPALIVEKGDKVAVEYTGRLENGTIFDSSVGRAPLEFEAGAGQMIKGFDEAVIGMKINETKTITLAPADAYGFPDNSLIIDVPIKNVPNGTKAGDILVAGFQQVTVVKVNSTVATIDTNHPLAGKTLIFDLKMLSITKKK